MVVVVSLTLAGAALVDGAAVAVLLYVAWVVSQREAEAEARRALHAFGVWWAGLALTVAGNAVKEALAALGLEREPVLVAALDAFQYVTILALCAAVWGLLYYLVYLYTGDPRWRARLGLFYAVYAALAVGLVARMEPAGVAPGRWFVQWAYARPAEGGALLVILTLLLLLPQIVAAAFYLRLTRRAGDALARFRIRLVGWSLLVWLGISLAAPFLQLGRFEWWQAGGRLVALAAAGLILLAFRPPARLARRLQEAGP